MLTNKISMYSLNDLESNLFGNKEVKTGLSIAVKQQQTIANE